MNASNYHRKTISRSIENTSHLRSIDLNASIRGMNCQLTLIGVILIAIKFNRFERVQLSLKSNVLHGIQSPPRLIDWSAEIWYTISIDIKIFYYL